MEVYRPTRREILKYAGRGLLAAAGLSTLGRSKAARAQSLEESVDSLNIYVSQSGSDLSDGTQAHPVRTIREAARRINLSGDSNPTNVLVMPGEYDEFGPDFDYLSIEFNQPSVISNLPGETKPEITGKIVGNNYLGVEGVVMKMPEGITGSNLQLWGKGFVRNNKLQGYDGSIFGSISGVFLVSTGKIDVTRNNISNYMIGINSRGPPRGLNHKIRQNYIETCDRGVNGAFISLDIGTQEDTGKNRFVNCVRAISNETDDIVTAFGNWFIIDDGFGNLRFLADEAEIKADQVSGVEIVSGLKNYDVNGDGDVNAVDVQTGVNGALGIETPNAYPDINLDGDVNAVDVQTIIRGALGMK